MSAGVTVERLGDRNNYPQTEKTSVEVSPCESNSQIQQPRQTISSPTDPSWELRTPTSLTQEQQQAASAPWLPGQLSDDGKELKFLTENDTNFMLRWAEELLSNTTEKKSDLDLLTTANNGTLGEAKEGVHQHGCLPVYRPTQSAAQCQETPTNSQQLGDACQSKTLNKQTFPPSQKCASLVCATAPDVQWYKCCTGSSSNDIVAQYASGATMNVLQLDGILLTLDDPQTVQVLANQNVGDASVTTPARRLSCRRQLWPEEQQKMHDITEGAPWYFNFPQKIRGGSSKRPVECTTDRGEADTHTPHERNQQTSPRANKAKRRHLDCVNRTCKGSGLQA
ncbi:uncharacterized protein LOC118426342 [Branchiostoma floridae]|uniref:Uncharacterized protein LOC118426342 n=1 Tax=Branchiostoma floridae TaxID=7739 RepID=A0A9J7LZD9_BRAFL|nr:uncharacterized protein LOC118426342 [Branchiostoma floridae]